MPRITICPRCTSHLGLPAEVSPAAQVQCPVCEVEFSLATVVPRELPQARVLEHVGRNDSAGAAHEVSPQERLSQLIRSTAARPPEPDEAKLRESYDDAYQDADPELGATQQPAQEDLQLGGSRLDQLLSDLTRAPTTPPPTFAETAPPVSESSAEQTSVEADSPLSSEFEADAADEDFARPPNEAAEAADQHGGDALHVDEDEAEEPVEVPALSGAPSGEAPPSELRTAPRRKRRSSGVRTLVGIIGGGALGILLGAYGLLWLGGADRDFLGISRYLPPSMLPPSASQVVDDDSASRRSKLPSTPLESDEQNPGLAAIEGSPMEFDPAVAPATAEEPIDDADESDALGSVLPQAPVAPPTVADPLPEQQGGPSTPIVGDLRGVKLYSADELAELIPAAVDAQREFLAGDLAREESWSTMGPAYMTLASLAERYTLVDPGAIGEDLQAKQAAAENIFREMLRVPERRADLATVAARWLQHERRLNQGAILVGRITAISPQGKWTRYTINVPLGNDFVTADALTDIAEFSVGDEVAIVGAILPRPAEQLVGYKGASGQVVVAGYVFPPEPTALPQPDTTPGPLSSDPSAGGQ